MTTISQHLRAAAFDPTDPGHWRGLDMAATRRALRARETRARLDDASEREAEIDFALTRVSRIIDAGPDVEDDFGSPEE